MEQGVVTDTDKGTPQGGPVSVLLSNLYLHYVLDLWIEKVVKPKMRGTLHYVRYLDDFVLCFQYRSDALRVQDALRKRLLKFSLEIEPEKTRLVEFGRFAQKWAKKRGCKVGTLYFLGFTLYCARNAKGNYKVGYKTEKKRFNRSLTKLKGLMRKLRHETLEHQCEQINQMLVGHYRYYGIAHNDRALQSVRHQAIRYWRKCLSSRSQRGKVSWEKFVKILKAYPLQVPKIHVPYTALKEMAVL